MHPIDMKKAIFLIASLLLYVSGSILLPSCSEDTVVERIGAARLNPSVSVDATLITTSGQRNVSPAPASSDLNFNISADDGKYDHTWESVNDYPTTELLRPGTYKISAFYGNETDEGFDCPYFYGSRNMNLLSGDDVSCDITATLASAVMQIEFSDALITGFQSVSAIIHTDGYSYTTVTSDESRQLFIHPGTTEIYISLTTSDGHEARIRMGTISETEAQHLYEIDFDSDGATEPTVTMKVNGKGAGSITVTEQLLLAQAPVITTSGFTSGTPLSIPEGDTPDNPLIFNISGENIASLVLTSMAPSINSSGWPGKIDLAKASDTELSLLRNSGLTITRSSSGNITSVDLTELVPKLRYSQESPASKFYLMAESANGKMSEPCSLEIMLQPVTISVISVSNVIIGVNTAEVTLLSRTGDLDKNLVIEARDSNGAWAACTIDAIESRGEGEYAVRFNAPEGNEEELPIRIIYCDNVLTEATLKRVSPSFSIKADAFAMSAWVQIESQETDMIPMITSLAQIYVNGSRTVYLQRVPETGTIYIGSLQPGQTYTLTATLFDNPQSDNFTPAVVIVTENTAQPQNNNFEEHSESIKYNRMPSGGRYSQSILDIFNQQNYTSFDYSEPSYWTTVNSKTFCTSAKNPNTWYMEPSAMSEVNNIEGYFAVRLRTTAWDNTGEDITPYRQNAETFLNYNPNIPTIKYRAAGKLFLGGYRFDSATLEENYDEGIDFTSRPAAVNGNYHFTPSPADMSDCGRIIVEVMGIVDGNEVAIASNSVLLQPALTYTSFSIPLTYTYFGVKATRLKIMLSSSQYVGSIEYESSHIKTYSDPVTATSFGGELWVQSLQLSYFLLPLQPHLLK